MTENSTEQTVQYDENALSSTQRDMLALMRSAVADMQKAKASDDMRIEKFVLSYLGGDSPETTLNEDDRNVTVGDILEAFAAAKAASGNLSDDERANLRKKAREQYNSAQTVLGAFPLPEGFPVPQLPGAQGPSAGTGEGGEKPRNLKHTVTVGDKSVDGTFAAISKPTGVPTADLLTAFKNVAGQNKEAWESSVEKRWTWDTPANSKGETYSVTTVYVEK